MSHPNPSTALARAVIDEMARGGVRFVVVSPGSRSAALAIAAAGHPLVSTAVSIDERSAGFHALGFAKATGSPAAVVCTSGTAAANLLPAVVEAEMSLTPMLVISADRPHELIGVGANQAIDQIGLYGNHVRRFVHIEAPDSTLDASSNWRAAVAAVVAACRGAAGMPGPAHLNIAFREPTVPVTDDGRAVAVAYAFTIEGRPDGGPWAEERPAEPPRAVLELSNASRGLVIAGEGTYDRERIAVEASRLGWPILATALSGMRGGGVVTSYHHLLAGGVPGSLRPEVAYAIGSIGPSLRLEGLFGSADARIRADYWGRHIDPGRSATSVLHTDPAMALAALDSGPADRGWEQAWLEADATAADMMRKYLESSPHMSGAAVASALSGADWGVLVVGSSLPIREVDSHTKGRGTIIANRGASGIDGFVSTALGAARVSPRTVALAGDLSVLHDANGLLIEDRPDLLLVVVDNGGGGIFDGLPPARHAPEYERLFVTPPGIDFRTFSDLFHVGYVEASGRDDLMAALADLPGRPGATLLRVPVDRHSDLATRAELDAVGAAVASGR